MIDCRDYKKGRCLGNCDGMGHFLCDECKWRKPKKRREYEKVEILFDDTERQADVAAKATDGYQ